VDFVLSAAFNESLVYLQIASVLVAQFLEKGEFVVGVGFLRTGEDFEGD
jgi:hypothetical protein